MTAERECASKSALSKNDAKMEGKSAKKESDIALLQIRLILPAVLSLASIGLKHTCAVRFESNDIYINIITVLFYLKKVAGWLSLLLHLWMWWSVSLQRIWYSIFSHDANEYKYSNCRGRHFAAPLEFSTIPFIESSRQMKRMNQIKLGKPTADGSSSRIEAKGALPDNTFAASEMSLSFRMQKSTSQCHVNEFKKNHAKEWVPKYNKKNPPYSTMRI